MRTTNRIDRRGISNVVATIILIAVAIALAVAVAVWVFGLAGGAAKTATLQIQAIGLTGVSSGSSANLTLLISNPSSSGISINGFTLGSLSCIFSSPVQVPAGTQGGELTITLTITKGAFTGVSGITGSGGVTVPSGTTAKCSGNQTAAVGIQYSGYLTTVSGQTYPYTVTATS